MAKHKLNESGVFPTALFVSAVVILAGAIGYVLHRQTRPPKRYATMHTSPANRARRDLLDALLDFYSEANRHKGPHSRVPALRVSDLLAGRYNTEEAKLALANWGSVKLWREAQAAGLDIVVSDACRGKEFGDLKDRDYLVLIKSNLKKGEVPFVGVRVNGEVVYDPLWLAQKNNRADSSLK